MAILKHSLIILQFDVCLLFVDVIRGISLVVNCFVPHRMHMSACVCVCACRHGACGAIALWYPDPQLLHDKMLIADGIKRWESVCQVD